MHQRQQIGQLQQKVLKQMAGKYIWWKTPDEAMDFPDRVVAQVMDIGDYDDVLTVIDTLGTETLRDVLTHAEIGQFSPRSWHYWHYRLGLAQSEADIPSMPVRKLG